MTPEEQANTAALAASAPTIEPARRLSWRRVIGVAFVGVATAAALVAFHAGSSTTVTAAPKSWFAPYVDVTATPQFAFEDPTQVTAAGVVLGFVVSPANSANSANNSPTDACQASWGGVYSLDAATSGLDLDRRIARAQQRGNEVSASFGGVANSELAIGCTDPDQLADAYQSVVTRYGLKTIDLDIETAAASTDSVDARRAAALKIVQQSRAAAGAPLAIWLTLPVNPDGLTDRGLAVLKSLLDARVDLAGVNALTMDYSQPGPIAASMSQLAENALVSLQRQLTDAYRSAGTILTADEASQKIGATPMIGQNDVAGQVFELTDAQQLLAFATAHHLLRLSMWSANRDQACGVNYANPEVVSGQCSGVNQPAGAYGAIFNGFASPVRPGSSSRPVQPINRSSASSASTAGTSPSGMTDDPATSPYPIWNPAGAYPKNTKIVWHHNVYEAKWWTSGDLPDAPVSDPSSTPWTLIGPVLPGEHPAPAPTLSAGTYPDWGPTQIYVAGQRVLLDGVGYHAKWWNQGQAPVPNPLQPSDTPWQLIGS